MTSDSRRVGWETVSKGQDRYLYFTRLSVKSRRSGGRLLVLTRTDPAVPGGIRVLVFDRDVMNRGRVPCFPVILGMLTRDREPKGFEDVGNFR